MIPQEELVFFKEKLKSSVRPLFFFDDDCDGVSSFVQLYNLVGDGKGVMVKGKPLIDENFYRYVEEYQPDVVFILDKPLVSQDFLDKISVDVLWLDHHPLQDNKKVKYFNPRKLNPEDNTPTSYWAYQIAELENKGCLWLAMLGIIADWNLSLKEDFCKSYPNLLSCEVDKPEDALFNSEMGKLIKIINFNLKGKTSDAMKSVKILTRIKEPEDILEQRTSQGKFIFKKYLKINDDFEKIKSSINNEDPNFLVFTYNTGQLSVTTDLANELLYENPNKIIIIGRSNDENIMMSIRSSEKKIVDVVSDTAERLGGYGGGHDTACGACVPNDRFEEFVNHLKEEFS